MHNKKIMNKELRIKNNITRNKKGFTLFEILLVVAMMALIASFAPPIFVQLQSKIGFDSTVSTYISSLRRAQNLSEAVKNDSAWGVKITNNNVTIFQGNSYDTRDSTMDETSTIFSNLNVTGSTEFVFKKMYGTPLLFGTTTISNQAGDSKYISVNSLGLISF